MTEQDILFSSYTLGKQLILKNRIVMSPMTRAKASDEMVPMQAMADYYARRADAGLIITEGTIIQPEARGHNNIPGIYNDAQIAAWKNVTDAVHAKNGRIFLQLWHVGRVSHPVFQNGKLPISASATSMTGRISRSELEFGMSRAATQNEIAELITQYANAARNAIKAGFDGVEIHGANGYLIDQFLHYSTNLREDEYGRTPGNMTRFPLAIVKACGEAIGYDKVGIRLSPGAYLNQIVGDKRDANVFAYLLQELSHLPILYVHTGNFDDKQTFAELENLTMTQFIRQYYTGTVIAAGSYTFDEARKKITANEFNLIAIGRPFIANPDLIARYQQGMPIKSYDVSMLQDLD